MQHMEVQDDMGRPYLGDLSSLEGYSALTNTGEPDNNIFQISKQFNIVS
jgi:hypothetical protein